MEQTVSTQDNLVILGLRQTPTQLNLDGILTPRELRDLRINLDQECVYRSQRAVAVPGRNAIPVETVTRLALYLSGRLVQAINPDSTLYRELQLEALVSSLALLQYHHVGSLHPDSWSSLQHGITERFSDIVSQRREHENPSADRNRQFHCLYLVRLASLYASRFRRSEPIFRALIAPVFQIIFAGYSITIGQNANISIISDAFEEILRLTQTPEKEYLQLIAFQELIRLATTMRFINGSDAVNGEFADTNTLENIMAKLNRTIRVIFDSIPRATRGHWRDVLLTFTGGNPKFDRGYYFYGLLDCAAQLGRYLDPDDLPKELRSELRTIKESLLSTPCDSVFRLKAIEIHVAYPSKREERCKNLIRNWAQKNPSIGSEVQGVCDVLEREGNLISRRSSATATQSSDSDQTSSILTPVSPQSSMTSERKRWDEPTFDRWNKHQSISSSSNLRRYNAAGISNDCSSVYFYGDREVVVHSLRVSQSVTSVESFRKKFDGITRVWDVALSKNYLVVSTLQNVLVFRHTRNSQQTPLKTFPSDNYHLSGLAIHETDEKVAILIGKFRKNLGSLAIHVCSLVNKSDRPVNDRLHFEEHTVDIPGHDYPKRLSFGQDGKTISCITGKLNTVLIWVVDGEFPSSMEPFVISNRYSPETNAEGVTSSSIFTSPSSGRMYFLTTTSPSSERCRNGGEWSYSSPVGRPCESLPPEDTHNFEQFGNHQSLVAGTVSRRCNIFAVLENTGRIFFLPLTGHSKGGIHSEVKDPIAIESCLCKQHRSSPHCLRFDPTGTRLYAVDAKGKIIVTTFEES